MNQINQSVKELQSLPSMLYHLPSSCFWLQHGWCGSASLQEWVLNVCLTARICIVGIYILNDLKNRRLNKDGMQNNLGQQEGVTSFHSAPLFSFLPKQQLCSSNYAVHLCCACRMGQSCPQHTGFSMDGLHGTCTDCCIADISLTEMWEPCVHMPGLRAMTVQHHLAGSA